VSATVAGCVSATAAREREGRETKKKRVGWLSNRKESKRLYISAIEMQASKQLSCVCR